MSKAVEQQFLYDGDVRISRDYRHQYKVQFLNAPHVIPPNRIASATGVTGLLDKSKFLLPWAVNQMSETLNGVLAEGREITPTVIKAAKATYRKTKEDAAQLGTRVHEWIHSFMLGRELPDSTGIEKIVERFESWWTAHILHEAESLGDERLVYSVDLNYAGQVDAIRRAGKRVCVIDYKTSKGVYKEHKWQLAGYVQALEEEGVIENSDDVERLIIHIDKETGGVTPYNLEEMAESADVIEYRSLEEDIQAFNSMRIIHHNVKGF